MAPVDADRHGGAGDRQRQGPGAAQLEAAEDVLQHRGVLVVADQPVGQPRRDRVEPARPGHAEVGVPGPPAVLDRGECPGVEHLDVAGHRSTCTKRTRAPGASVAGRSSPLSHSVRSVRPSSRQPPGDSVG